MGLIPGPGRSPGGEDGNPLQYACLENPLNRGAWQITGPGVTNSWTRLKSLSLHAHIADSLCCTVKTQHCKTIILQ